MPNRLLRQASVPKVVGSRHGDRSDVGSVTRGFAVILASEGAESAECRICGLGKRALVAIGRVGVVLSAAVLLVALGAIASAGAAEPVVPTTSPHFTTTTVGRTKSPTTTTTSVTTTTVVAPTTTTTAAATTTTFPAALQAIANAVKRSPPSNTTALFAALAPLEKLGYTAQQAAIVGMGQFPVAGPSYYTDDWLEPRSVPTPHLHMGDDIVAAVGTPIRSPINGVLKYDDTDPDGYGLAADVTGPDKTYYVMAHMSADAAGLATGSVVTQGEVVGYVGDSGDASGPHCHFEVHPLGGAGIDPKPILDAWQAAAIAAAPALIQSIEEAQHPTTTTVAPLPVAPSAPQAALPSPLGGAVPIRETAQGSPTALALVGLIVLLAAGTLSVRDLRRSRSRRAPQSPFSSA